MKRHLAFACSGLAAALLLSTVTTVTACKRRKFSTNQASVKGLATKDVLKADMDGYANVDGTIDQPGDVVFEITVVDPTASQNLANIDFSIDPSDSGYFSKNKTKLKTSLTVTTGGAEKTLIDKQELESNDYNWSTSTNQVFQAGDVFRVVIHDVPDALKASNVYLYANVRRPSPQSIDDSLDKWGSWDAREAFLADSANLDKQVGATTSTASLFELSTNVSVFAPSIDASGKPYFRGINSTSSDSECGSLVFKGTAEGQIQGKTALETYTLEPAALQRGGTVSDDPCRLDGSASLKTEVGPINFITKGTGLVPNLSFAETSHSIYSQLRGDKIQPLQKESLLTITQPGSYDNQEFTTEHVKGAEYSFLLTGVTKKTGLKVNGINFNFYYPSNSPAKTSSFDGTGFEIELVNIVKDSSGKRLASTWTSGNLASSSRERQYVSFDQISLGNLESGDYELLIKTPATFAEGTYIRVYASVERLNSFVPILDEGTSNDTVGDFKARDTASNAKVHDWVRVNYSDATQGKGEKINMTETLRHMEEIRDTFHNAVNEINPFTKAAPVAGPLNTTDFGTIGACLANQAEHWSDITIHYYCIHAALRTCYTSAIRSTGPEMAKVREAEIALGKTGDTLNGAIACKLPTMPAGWNPDSTAFVADKSVLTVPVLPIDAGGQYSTLRRYAYYTCALPKGATQPDTTGPTNHPVFKGCEASKNYVYKTSDYDREAFGWLTDSSRSTHGPVFRYLMDAPTFAFSLEELDSSGNKVFSDKQEQDIINAFWRVTKPEDPTDCAKRPVRAIDPSDGTHCLPNARKATAGFKVQSPLLAPAGR